MDFDEDTYEIIGAAMEVHRELGPGYLEAVYQEAMEIEFRRRSIGFISQPQMEIEYKGEKLRKYYVPDFLVEGRIPVELKAHSAPIVQADSKQIINSLKTSGMRVGLLLNFGCKSLEYKRYVL